MSREVDKSDLSSLEDVDLKYLHERGQITTAQFAEAMDMEEGELRTALKELHQNSIPLEDRANTGTANTANLTKEEFEAKAAALADDDSDDEDEEEDDDRPYEEWTNDELRGEIAARNADRAEEDQLSLDGKKAELIATLEGDDEGNEE